MTLKSRFKQNRNCSIQDIQDVFSFDSQPGAIKTCVFGTFLHFLQANAEIGYVCVSTVVSLTNILSFRAVSLVQ
jgi:hypothetical protein